MKEKKELKEKDSELVNGGFTIDENLSNDRFLRKLNPKCKDCNTNLDFQSLIGRYPDLLICLCPNCGKTNYLHLFNNQIRRQDIH